jgi:hypothetical protein
LFAGLAAAACGVDAGAVVAEDDVEEDDVDGVVGASGVREAAYSASAGVEGEDAAALLLAFCTGIVDGATGFFVK